MSTETVRLIRTESPGRPPRLPRSSCTFQPGIFIGWSSEGVKTALLAAHFNAEYTGGDGEALDMFLPPPTSRDLGPR